MIINYYLCPRLAHPWASAYWKHGRYALILNSVSWKLAIAYQQAQAPHLFPAVVRFQLTISFAWEKANLISIAENWINKEDSSFTLVFHILPFFNHVKRFGSKFNGEFSFLSKSNLIHLIVSDTMYLLWFNDCMFVWVSVTKI